MKRMNRDQFFTTLSTLDDERLQKTLWNLYWRGSAAMRERIEAELDPSTAPTKDPHKELADPKEVLREVSDFVTLARSGAYLAGDRRVSPRERSRWRFTFQHLARDAIQSLRGEGCADGIRAVERLIDLACDLRGYDYFHSDDPVEAARFVVSDVTAMMWTRVRDQFGFSEFVERAAPQLVRWESKYGWTRSGYGRVSEQETSLAHVLSEMLWAPDMWMSFTDRYLEALDQVAHGVESTRKRTWQREDWSRTERTAALAEWHHWLLEKLFGSEGEDRLDTLARHPALGGPELAFFQAQLAHRRDDVDGARTLVLEALGKLPGHQGFLDFALHVGAPLASRRQ